MTASLYPVTLEKAEEIIPVLGKLQLQNDPHAERAVGYIRINFNVFRKLLKEQAQIHYH